MALNRRQSRVYTHRVDLWQPTDDVAAAGPQDRTYALVASAVPCYLGKKSSVDQVGDLAMVESEDLISTDQLRLAAFGYETAAHNTASAAIETNWIAIDKSLLPDGSQGGEYGKGWIVRGSPRRVIGTNVRTSSEVIAYLSRLPILPAGVA